MEETQQHTEASSSETHTEAQLVELVKKQVEYYFSKENLLVDPFLSSQMDAQMCVPISVVMKFPKLKALTQDEEILRKALVDSAAVSVQENKIKANIKPPGRSTIILREIPSDAPLEEVKEIFNYPGAKVASSLRSEIGDTWFVTMESEEDAKDTLLDLRLKKRTFRGAAVKARLKTETVVRSFFPVQTAITPVVPFGGMMQAGIPVPVVDMRAYGYMGLPVPVMTPVETADASNNAAAVESAAGVSNGEVRHSPSKVAAAAGSKDAGRSARGQNAATGKGSSNTQGAGRRQGDAASSSTGASGRNAKGGKDKEKKEEAVPRQTIEINVANFPPLCGGEDTPVPTPGYKGVYQKYSGDEIINIAKGVKETKLPATLNPSMHPLAMTVDPNKDLLRRQRTFSIDETREQLRQGRPVQRDAILPGKVDTRSLYCGDESASAPAAKKEAIAAPVASPSACKKTVPTTPVPPSAEASAAVADVVEHVTASAATMAVSETAAPVVVAMNSATPQKITPSTWAAMIKSSATEAAVVPATATKTAAPAATRRTPAKETVAAKSSSAASTGGKIKGGDKENKAEGEGRSRRKNSEGSHEGRAKGKKAATDAGTPARSDNNKTAAADAAKTAEEPAPTWGGKASFANILKLNADAESFSPASTSSPPTQSPTKASTAPATGAQNGERRRNGTAAPTKPAASKQPREAPAAGEWSTSTGKSRTRETRTEGEARSTRPAAGSGSTDSTGANAKGIWARETLPPTQKAEK